MRFREFYTSCPMVYFLSFVTVKSTIPLMGVCHFAESHSQVRTRHQDALRGAALAGT